MQYVTQYIDPNAKHQLTIRFVRDNTAVQGVCNCGASFAVKDPTHPESLPSTKADYEEHVRAFKLRFRRVQ